MVTKDMVLLFVTGSLNYDVTMYVEYFAPPKSIVRKLRRYLGGSGGNAAVAASRLLQGVGKVVFFGAVGSDDIGVKHIEALRREGIDTSLIRVIDNEETGQAFVAVNNEGESAIYSYYGANLRLGVDDIDEDVMKYLSSANALLIMNPPVEVAYKLMSTYKSLRSGMVFWDPGAYASRGLENLTPLVKLTDYLMPNEHELLILTNASIINEAVKEVWSINPSVKIVVKSGERGSTLFNPLDRKVVKIPSLPLSKVGLKVISTVGCGDAYDGVFTASKTLGYNDVDSMKLATCAAAINASCEEPRCTPPREKLLKFFHKYNNLLNVSVSNLRD